MNANTRRICLAFGALFSVLIVTLLFGIILFIFVTTSPIVSEPMEEFSSANNSETIEQPSATIIVDNKNELLEIARNISDAAAIALRNPLSEEHSQRVKAELLVKWVNAEVNSSWTARLNPSAIGIEVLEQSTEEFKSEFSRITYENKLIQLFDKFNEITERFYPFFDAHLYILEKNFLAANATLAANFHARRHWPRCAQNLVRVTNQGACGSCYALAAASAMTDRICVFSEGRIQNTISAQHIIDCCAYCGGCNGTTDPLLSFMFWYESGVVPERCHPFTVNQTCGHPCMLHRYYPANDVASCQARTCTEPLEPYNLFHAKYVYKLGNLNEDADFGLSLYERYRVTRPTAAARKIRSVADLLRLELMEFGPVVLCFSVYEAFLHYFEGVYDFRHQPDEVVVYDHCVKVIGFGNYFRADRVVGKYLLAVNSWSSRWAKDGTFKIDLNELARQNRSDLYAGIPQLIY